MTRGILLKRFSQRLRGAMQKAGMGRSPTKLAHHFNLRYWGQSITVTAANNWIWGVSFPQWDKMIVLSEVVGVSLDTLLGGEPVDRGGGRANAPMSGDSTWHEPMLVDDAEKMGVKRIVLRENDEVQVVKHC